MCDSQPGSRGTPNLAHEVPSRGDGRGAAPVLVFTWKFPKALLPALQRQTRNWWQREGRSSP